MPRHAVKEALLVGVGRGIMLGVVIQVVSAGTARVDFIAPAINGRDAQESRISDKLLLAKDGLFVATSMIALSSYSSNSALTFHSQPCRIPQCTKTIRGCCGITGR